MGQMPRNLNRSAEPKVRKFGVPKEPPDGKEPRFNVTAPEKACNANKVAPAKNNSKAEECGGKRIVERSNPMEGAAQPAKEDRNKSD
ncbi:hypothetical protein DXG03_007316 [Asterophora parasitica]|uniref:Uncharacterized protein n=1 Tax=Asterophora parasitica TaxID=117018 RepID=A0A9P7G4R3_9AGAR|nr:hypothetical protein DXG03_007316 [Asterophora parasitica]